MRKNYICNITSDTKIDDFSRTHRMWPSASPLQMALETLIYANPHRQKKQVLERDRSGSSEAIGTPRERNIGAD
jgi:hypothetical protein